MPSRRRVLQGLATLGPWCAVARAGAPTGWLPLRLRPPPIRLQMADGVSRSLPQLLTGRVTWVQLMYTGCSSTCPPQAALFAALAERADPGRTRLLSLSIDALGDSPTALAGWLRRLRAPAHWQAGVPAMMDVGRLGHFLRGVPPTADPAGHTAQVFVFDAEGQLAYRSGDLPPVSQLLALRQRLA